VGSIRETKRDRERREGRNNNNKKQMEKPPPSFSSSFLFDTTPWSRPSLLFFFVKKRLGRVNVHKKEGEQEKGET
jgi:hypothetical protein